MKEVLHKRQAPFLHRNAKVRGDMAAGTLGDIQTKKPPKDFKNGHFRWTPAKVHVHTWVFGTVNACCTQCGKTVPKHQAAP